MLVEETNVSDAMPELPSELWLEILNKVAEMCSNDTPNELLQLMPTSQSFKTLILEYTSREFTLSIKQSVNTYMQACSVESYIYCRAAKAEVIHIQLIPYEKDSTSWLQRVMPSLAFCDKLKCLELTIAGLAEARYDAAQLLNTLPSGLTSLHCKGFDLYASRAWDTQPLCGLKDFQANFSDIYCADPRCEKVGDLSGLECLCLGGFDDAKYLPWRIANLSRLTSLQLPHMRYLDERLMARMRYWPVLQELFLPNLSTMGIPEELGLLQDHPCLQKNITARSCLWETFILAATMPQMRSLSIGNLVDEAQELAEMDWSEVRLVDLTLDWYWSPQASHKSNDHRDAALRYTLDIASLMLAPRLRSFSLFCGNLKLHNYSMITRQMLDAKHLKLILRSMRKFDDEDAAWLQSLGHKMTRIEPEGPVQLPFYWESRC